ncbi:hypothetical protein KBY66_10920 [Synechococcus sp. Tobar12-5m-g]|uniref:hypothetical protein n=1 Tax=unclassified Synechococcus TaxID=2626047 RepID=UPI0020CD791D|nr:MULTISPECIES: hypothetical protein [unclassified Synechococcus]MCP9773133.1 hypothetical protein [Synechococcus sp. Tobar12-5m-g]MCP9874039.1 hypothetical protein [Synechococcus sp. Cruz CV-v-12]
MGQASLHRVLAAQVSWASARIAALDGHERYEDSFALTEEFREWILCVDDHPGRLEALLAPLPPLRRRAEWPPGEPRQPEGFIES